MKQPNPKLPADLVAAQEQFSRWRMEHKPRSRFQIIYVVGGRVGLPIRP